MAETIEAPTGLWEAGRGGFIHVANIKGGVGKSTLATNLAASLSARGPTLVIDLDVQGSVSVALGIGQDRAPERTSCDFFNRRFESLPPISAYFDGFDPVGLLAKLEEVALGRIFGGGAVDSAIARATPELHVVPAGPGLFNAPAGYLYGNFLHNLNIVKQRYKYIVIDTPSVWNKLTKFLYVNCDLNLIPVTLDSLSTNSFKDYLVHIKRLISHNSHVRLRIVKNEVGRGDEGVDGKPARSISLNRRFLDSLCEEVAVHNDSGMALLPQSIMLDLEIPESAAIRDAQDVGKSVREHGGDPDAARAFDTLAKSVQGVLNGIQRENIAASALEKRIFLAFKTAAAAALLALVAMNPAIPDAAAPRPIAPQQMAESNSAAGFEHTFAKGDNIGRMAKYAISVFRAVVPSQKEISRYIVETIDAHNMTRTRGEPKINDYNRVPEGTKLTFYPPMSITNKQEKAHAPAYKFFMGMVNDPYPYVTGDWCERGIGGGQPHYAMDVAGAYGSEIVSPVDGVAALKTEAAGGRTVAVMFGEEVIAFSHLDKRFVKDGDIVKKGMPIGTIGMTGRTSGPHAHIMYGIMSMSRHDISFAKNNYRVTDPKYLFYKMAFGEITGEGAQQSPPLTASPPQAPLFETTIDQ
jgi:cellulose biosynthesis protein BcsQ/murein DD-endopeptidase MepM/ murein hydrolase activator NlpD